VTSAVTSILLVLPAGLIIGLAFALLLGGFLLLGRHPSSVIFVSLGTLTGSYAADRVARAGIIWAVRMAFPRFRR